MEKIKTALLEKIEPLISKIGELTKVQRYLIYGGTLLILVGVYAYFIYLPMQTELSDLETNLAQLEDSLRQTKKKAAQLKRYQRKMEEAKVQFEIVKKTLPEKKDIPELLTAVSQSGRDAGLNFLLFQPRREQLKDFYAEIPVSIEVTGSYHNLALFFAKVANLSRIVNIRDIRINSSGRSLSTKCTAVTYRFIDAKEAQKKKKKKKRKRRR